MSKVHKIMVMIQAKRLKDFVATRRIQNIQEFINKELKKCGIPADSRYTGMVKKGFLSSRYDKHGNLHFEWTP